MSALLVLSGCYDGDSSANGGGAGGDASDGAGGTEGSVPEGVDASDFPAPLAPRLNDAQYRYTLLDVLGLELTEAEAQLLPRDVPTEGAYSTSVDGQFFNTQYVLAYAKIARALSERLEPSSLLTTFGDCTGTDAACLEAFVTGLGLRLFRRPLSESEIGGYLDLAASITASDATSEADVVRGLLQTMLQAPYFLYRIESEADAEPDTLEQVDGYELASRLSYFLWQSAPDDELLAFAADAERQGGYAIADVESQVARMMSDPRYARSRRMFWGDYSLASVSTFGSAEAALAEELRESLLATFERLSGVDAPAQPLSAIFDTTEVVMTGAVAELAGASPKAAELAVYADDEMEERLGVITHPGFIAAMGTTSFVGRGVFMTKRLLCQRTGSPPADTTTTERIMETEQQTADMTPREASEFRFGLEPACLACHQQFEPISYAFERYDLHGRFTTADEQGRPLYSDGTLPPFGERPEITFATAPELLGKLAEVPELHACFVENMMEYATGSEHRPSELLRDDATARFEAEGLTFDALVRAVATNPRITLKRMAAP